MRKTPKFIIGAGAVALIMGSLAFSPQVAFAGGEMPSKDACKDAKDNVTKGGCVATDRKKGNCMACHTFAGLEKTRLQAGNIAPPLVAMKTRFPDRAKLRAQVWDAAKNNSATVMPPFGRHKVLSEKEIDLVVDWLQTL
jgi:sulfur-oxidizing protein SoxX